MEALQKAKRLAKSIYYRPSVQGTVIRVVSQIAPPPYLTDTMEFDYGLWLGISALHCEDSRQLGEDNTWPRLFRERIPTEYHTSNMPGSRAGSTINMTTLHIVMKRWGDVIPLIESLRANYDSRFAHDAGPLQLSDLYMLSKSGVALPALMARRGTSDRVIDGSLPATVATQFKVIAGVFMVVQDMLWSGRYSADSRVDPETFFDDADDNGIFISPSGNACGGSRRKIIELYETVYRPGDQIAASLDLIAAYADATQLFDYAANSVWLEQLIVGAQRELQRKYYLAAERLTSDQRSQDLAAHIERTVSSKGSEGSPDFKRRGVWPVLDRTLAADIPHPVTISSNQIRQKLALEEELLSVDAVVEHYRNCLEVMAELSTASQRLIADILGRAAPKAISVKAVARRLNVIPKGLTSVRGRQGRH